MTRRYIEPLPDNPAYYLGGLCKNRHAYADTNKTLRRRSDRECPECNRLRNKKWETQNVVRRNEKQRNRDLVRVFGMNLEEYNALLSAQNGVCDICGDSAQARRLAVDHCPKTGKIRALLCGNCNTGLGLFKESPALLEQAIRYLKTHGHKINERSEAM